MLVWACLDDSLWQELQTLPYLLQIKEYKNLICASDLTNALPILVQYFR